MDEVLSAKCVGFSYELKLIFFRENYELSLVELERKERSHFDRRLFTEKADAAHFGVVELNLLLCERFVGDFGVAEDVVLEVEVLQGVFGVTVKFSQKINLQIGDALAEGPAFGAGEILEREDPVDSKYNEKL